MSRGTLLVCYGRQDYSVRNVALRAANIAILVRQPREARRRDGAETREGCDCAQQVRLGEQQEQKRLGHLGWRTMSIAIFFLSTRRNVGLIIARRAHSGPTSPYAGPRPCVQNVNIQEPESPPCKMKRYICKEHPIDCSWQCFHCFWPRPSWVAFPQWLPKALRNA